MIASLDLNLQSRTAEEINNTYFIGTAWGGCTHHKRNWTNKWSMGARKAICRGSTAEQAEQQAASAPKEPRVSRTAAHVTQTTWKGPGALCHRNCQNKQTQGKQEQQLWSKSHIADTLVEGECLNCNKQTENHSAALNTKSNFLLPKARVIFVFFCLLMSKLHCNSFVFGSWLSSKHSLKNPVW